MSVRSYAFNCFEKMAPKSSNNSYMFKRGRALNILGIFKAKGILNTQG